MWYKSETYKDLQELNAGNLYLSVIIKAKACTNFEDPKTVFELLGGNYDITILKDIYEKQGFFKTDKTGVELMNALEENYKKLCAPHVSKTIVEEEAIKKYEIAKLYYLNQFLLIETDFATFHQANVMDYLNKAITQCIKTESNSYQKLLK